MTDRFITVPRCSFCGDTNANSLRPFSPFSRDDQWHSCYRRSCLSESYKRQAALDMGADSPEYEAYVGEMRKLAIERQESDATIGTQRGQSKGLSNPTMPRF